MKLCNRYSCDHVITTAKTGRASVASKFCFLIAVFLTFHHRYCRNCNARVRFPVFEVVPPCIAITYNIGINVLQKHQKVVPQKYAEEHSWQDTDTSVDLHAKHDLVSWDVAAPLLTSFLLALISVSANLHSASNSSRLWILNKTRLQGYTHFVWGRLERILFLTWNADWWNLICQDRAWTESLLCEAVQDTNAPVLHQNLLHEHVYNSCNEPNTCFSVSPNDCTPQRQRWHRCGQGQPIHLWKYFVVHLDECQTCNVEYVLTVCTAQFQALQECTQGHFWALVQSGWIGKMRSNWSSQFCLDAAAVLAQCLWCLIFLALFNAVFSALSLLSYLGCLFTNCWQ